MGQYLLDNKNVNVHIRACDKMTVLHAAVAGHNHEGLAMLLARKNSDEGWMEDWMVNAGDKYRRTPLWRAVECCALDCVKLLLGDERVDPNIEAYQGSDYSPSSVLFSKDQHGRATALVYAVKRGFLVIPLLKALLANPRTDPNAHFCSYFSGTALMYAVRENKQDIVEILLADPRVDLDTTGPVERRAGPEDLTR